MNDETVPVIRTKNARAEAYAVGVREFEDAEGPVDLDGFRESARYSNSVLPDLRALAGFDDSGVGTYQVDRDVALVDPADESDVPIEAARVPASWVLDEDVLPAFENGVRDAVDGPAD